MKFSGAFEDAFVDQVQVVAYVHSWQPNSSTGGEFVYWNENAAPQRVKPIPRSGTAVDGSKVVHAATVYRPDVVPPLIDKSKDNVLKYVRELDSWKVSSNGETVGVYNTNDIRATIVYRARCFVDAREAETFRALPESDYFSLDSVLGRLGRVLLQEHGLDIDQRKTSPLNTALAILDNVIKYPLPADVYLPLNYCALARLAPWTAPLLRPFC